MKYSVTQTRAFSEQRQMESRNMENFSTQTLEDGCRALEKLMESTADTKRSLGNLILQFALMEVHRELEAEIFYRRGEIWIV